MTRIAQEIPKIGLVMEQVRIAHWLKRVGDHVTQGEPICEVESEKSVVEIEAEASGVLVEIVLDVDREATVGDLLAWIETDQAHNPSLTLKDARQPTATAIADQGGTALSHEKTALSHEKTALSATIPVSLPVSERVPSSPAARRRARELGIDISTLTGTGPRGRVQLADVDAARPENRAGNTADAGTLSPMRRALARAMQLSNATVPQFVVERAVDWTCVEHHRQRLNQERGNGQPPISVNDFLLRSVAIALLEFPQMNAIFEGDANGTSARILPADGAHIGLVVAVDDGLIVPVLHRVDQLDLAETAALREACVRRGVAGRLKADELNGATISISNLGRNGPDRFSAIINPPQSAILAVGRPVDTVVARDGAIMIRPLSALCLSVDHRLIDGRLAADFLARVVALLETHHWQH